MVRRAGERTRLHVRETHGAADVTELVELPGRVKPDDRQMLLGGPEVLAKRQNIDVALPEITHCHEELVPFFAQPENDPRFGETVRHHAAGPAQELERPIVPAAG